MTARSYLFVPGDRSDMLAKAGARGADAIIADLEDAVAPDRKGAARASVADWLNDLRDLRCEVWVRVNPGEGLLVDDLTAVTHPGIDGVMVPKVRSVDELLEIGTLLSRFESVAGIPAGAVRLLPIVETARGLQEVDDLARAPRVHQLMIGEYDLGAELGVDPSNESAFVPLRMQLVVASAAASIAPPIGPVSADFRDLAGLRDESERLARLGFASRPAIHPAQVPVINDVFSPDPALVERARRLIELYEAALAEGRGAVTDEDGRMVDEAVVKVARRLLETSRRSQQS